MDGYRLLRGHLQPLEEGGVALGQVIAAAGSRLAPAVVGLPLLVLPAFQGAPELPVGRDLQLVGAGAQAGLLEAEGIEVTDGKVDLEKYAMYAGGKPSDAESGIWFSPR